MEEHGLLSYVKKVVHSLIVSTPLAMTVEHLKRDYIKEEGDVIPFSKLGFKDVESFLRSIPETVSVIGYGPMALLQAKKNEKSAHIQSLVQCQKKPSVKARKQIWSRYPTKQSDLVFVNEKSNASRTVHNNNRGRGSYATNKNNYNSRQVHQRPATTSIASSLEKITIANVDDSSEDNFKLYVPDDKDIKPIILDENPIATYHTEYISSDEGCNEDAFPANAVDDQILNNKYSKDINDNRVIDVKREIKTELIEPNKEPVIEYVSSDDGNDEDAIPAYAVDDRVLKVNYPTDAVHYDFLLPVRDINKKLKLDDRILVLLATVSSPHSFFFWIHDEEYDTYKTMTINMQFYYSNIDMKKYTIPLNLIMPDHLAAIHTRGTLWQRVRVLAVKMGNRKNIEVELIDTGERMWICHSDLKYLCKDFATLPAQCIYGRLARIMPRQGAHFSVDASNYFYDLVSYRQLFAKVEKINNADNAVHMILVDLNKTPAVNINLTLLERGCVRRSYNP